MSASATIARAPQHLQALQRANEVRLARADLKRRVAQGHVSAAEVVLACPPEVEGMAVADLLMSQRRWGRTRCRKFLAAIPLAENKSIGSMTDRQRRALAMALPKRLPVREAREMTAAAPSPDYALSGAA
jgi:recombinational DNA repair protein RecR